MVALCEQCDAPLSPADLGYTCCLNCHWQQVFDYPDDPALGGELRLVLYGLPGAQAKDRGRRLWNHFPGDGHAWCTLCGATVDQGWVQGQLGWLQTFVCAIHVDLVFEPGKLYRSDH